MKKKIAFLLAISILCVSLTACGSEKKETDSNKSNISSSSSDAPSSENISDTSEDEKNDNAVSSTPAGSDNAASGTTSQPAQSPEQTPEQNPVTPQTPSNTQTSSKPETPAQPQPTPQVEPAPKPETPAKSPAVSDIAASIDKALGVDSNFMTFSADDVAMNYGIGSSSMVEFVGKMPMMSVKATEYLVVKAADGQVDAVKNGMIKRQSDLDAQWKQYLPEQYELVKNYKLVTNGNYVLFVIGENASGAVDAFNSMTK